MKSTRCAKKMTTAVLTLSLLVSVASPSLLYAGLPDFFGSFFNKPTVGSQQVDREGAAEVPSGNSQAFFAKVKDVMKKFLPIVPVLLAIPVGVLSAKYFGSKKSVAPVVKKSGVGSALKWAAKKFFGGALPTAGVVLTGGITFLVAWKLFLSRVWNGFCGDTGEFINQQREAFRRDLEGALGQARQDYEGALGVTRQHVDGVLDKTGETTKVVTDNVQGVLDKAGETTATVAGHLQETVGSVGALTDDVGRNAQAVLVAVNGTTDNVTKNLKETADGVEQTGLHAVEELLPAVGRGCSRCFCFGSKDCCGLGSLGSRFRSLCSRGAEPALRQAQGNREDKYKVAPLPEEGLDNDDEEEEEGEVTVVGGGTDMLPGKKLGGAEDEESPRGGLLGLLDSCVQGLDRFISPKDYETKTRKSETLDQQKHSLAPVLEPVKEDGPKSAFESKVDGDGEISLRLIRPESLVPEERLQMTDNSRIIVPDDAVAVIRRPQGSQGVSVIGSEDD